MLTIVLSLEHSMYISRHSFYYNKKKKRKLIFLYSLIVAPRTKTGWMVPEAWITTGAQIARVLPRCTIRVFTVRADWKDGKAITGMRIYPCRARTCPIIISMSLIRPS